VANAGFARYVMGVNGAVVDQGSQGGRTASYSWNYKGPKFNTTCTPPNCLQAADILPGMFAWFNQNVGTSNTNYRNAPSIPGVTTHVGTNTIAPSSDEITLGLAHELGKVGTVRVDYTHRRYHDMYGSYTDTTTGQVTDPTGRKYDAEIVKNTPDAQRWYNAVTVSANTRLAGNFTIGGNYTLSYSKGNNDGENVGSGPTMASINYFPEYRQESWNWPTGWMMNDQRHKVRLYATYLLPLRQTLGNFTVGVVQRVNTGSPYDIGFTVDPTTYVTNPGYLAPPTNVTYYIDGRGPNRTDTIYNTDLSFVWTRRVHVTVELFFRGLAYNIFNGQGVLAVDSTVSSYASPGDFKKADFAPFNPFTTTPVKDVNYRYGLKYGQPVQPTDVQESRTVSFSFVVRF
jgi:hypothetical protein